MNWSQTVNTLIFVFGTFISILEAMHLANIQRQKMPDHLVSKLEKFTRIAVQQIEQQHKEMSGPAKKQLAINTVLKLFKSYKLPVPSDEALDIAIESAVFSLHKDNNSPSS